MGGRAPGGDGPDHGEHLRLLVVPVRGGHHHLQEAGEEKTKVYPAKMEDNKMYKAKVERLNSNGQAG